jgi:WD40 repeat protein
MAFSPDGRHLATLDWTIRLWDVATGRLVREIEHGKLMENAVAFSPDGKKLVTAHYELVSIWDLATGKRTALWRGRPSREPLELAFRPDGKVLAILCKEDSHENVIRLFDFLTCKDLGVLHSDERVYRWHGLTFSPDGRRLAFAVERSLQVWDAVGRKRLVNIDVGGQVLSLAFSPDGRKVAVHPRNSSVSLVSIEGTPGIVPMGVRGEWESTLRFDSRGKELWFASGEGVVRAVDPAGRERPGTVVRLRPAVEPGGENNPCFSPDGRWVAFYAWRPIRIASLVSGKEPHCFDDHRDGSYFDLAVCPRGQWVATCSDSELRIWELRTGKLLKRIACENWRRGVSWTPDGRSVVICETGRLVWWDAETGRLARQIPVPAGKPVRALLLPDGRTLVCQFGRSNDTYLFLDAISGREKLRLAREGDYTSRLSPDGRWRVATQPDRSNDLRYGTVWMREVSTGRLLWKEKRFAFDSVFTPDGRLVLLGGRELVEVRETLTGRLVGPPVTIETGPNGTEALGLSPDGRTAIVRVSGESSCRAGDGEGGRTIPVNRILLIETATGRVRHHLPPLDDVLECAFSPDGRHLVTSGRDASALVWDLYPNRPTKSPDADRLWADLANADAEKAFAAIRRLVSAPTASLKDIARRFRPADADARRVRRWLADLNADTFATREEASRKLAELGEDVELDLYEACATATSQEARRRLDRLLAARENAHDNPVRRQRTRALEVLEQIATPEAHRLLKALAGGAAGSRLTREAKETLERLAARGKEKP